MSKAASPLVKSDQEEGTPKLVRPHCKGWFQWIPSDLDQLAHTEGLMLASVNDRLTQRFVAGLNTVSSTLTPDTIERVKAFDRARPNEQLKVQHIVLVHGFGGGLAVWLPNIKGFLVAADHPTLGQLNTVLFVHAIDMPGFGRSRVDTVSSKDQKARSGFKDHHDAIAWLTDHIENWFQAMDLENVAKWLPFLFNSQGETAAKAEAARSGTDGDTNDNDAAAAVKPTAATDEGAALPRQATRHTTRITLEGHSFGAFTSANYCMRYPRRVQHLILADPWGVPEAHDRQLPLKFRIALKFFYWGKPFSVLRGAGPLGPKAVPAVRKDFVARWEPLVGDANIFYDYVFHCNAQDHPLGELAFQACCTGPMFSKMPLLHQLHARLDKDTELSLLYGSHTWMDTDAGGEMLKKVLDARASTTGVHKTSCAAVNAMFLIPGAGHQCASDNPFVFNNRTLAFMGLLL